MKKPVGRNRFLNWLLGPDSWQKVLLGSLLTWVIVALVAWWLVSSVLGRDTVESKTKAAESTARALKLESPVVYCDPSSKLLCGCLVVHGSPENRRVESWACCGGGCD